MASSLFPLRAENNFPVEGDGSHNEAFRRVPLDRFNLGKNGDVVTIDSNVSIIDAIKILSDQRVQSVPVRDVSKGEKAPLKEKYIGTIDFMSIISWLMTGAWGYAPKSLEELRSLKQRFSTTSVSHLLSYARTSPFVPIDLNENDFTDVMILLGKYGIRRVFTVDLAASRLLGVISQRKALEVVANNMDQFPDLSSKPIKSLGIGQVHPVISVNLMDTYWDAFNALQTYGIHSVPVVDGDGKLTGGICTCDFKDMVLDASKFGNLARPIAESLSREHEQYTCRLEDTFEQVVRKFESFHIYCLYIVDDSFRPISVVALRDVLAACVREPVDKEQQFRNYASARPFASEQQ